MKTRIGHFVRKGGILLLVVTATALADSKQPPVWERAGQAYDLCMKIYSLSDWEKAASAFSQFVEKYPTNQNVPLAYIQMAHCYFNLGKDKQAVTALDVVTKKFTASRVAADAWGKKLNLVRDQDDPDRWLDLYEELSKQFGKAPLELSDHIDWRNIKKYWWSIDNTYFYFPHWRRTGWYLQAAETNMRWVENLLWAADTPARAIRALDIIAGTLKTYGDDLPEDWKYAHVLLLRKAAEASEEKDTAESPATAPADKPRTRTAVKTMPKARKTISPEAAEKQFQTYLSVYPKNDPHIIGLWMREADYWSEKDAEKTDKIWSDMMEAFPGYDSLGEFSEKRMDVLYDRRRYDDFVTMARWYLKHFPLGSWRDKAINRWIDMARERAEQGDAGRIPVVLKVLDEEQKRYPLDPVRIRRNLDRRIDLHLAAGNVAEAVKLAGELVSQPYWSAESFEKVEALAKADKKFEPVLAAARKTYKIPAVNETSPAREIYDDLQSRIQDNQTRHMEELGDKLLSEHRNDAYAILGLKALVDYYYSKAIHQSRDKWADLMAGAYPLHPLTQDALSKQADALYGAKDFSRAGPVYNLAFERFPGANSSEHWFGRRVECFSALQKIKARNKYALEKLEKRALGGELEAIGRLGDILESGADDHKAKGDFWAPWCAKWGEKTYQGVYCHARAYEAYYVTPAKMSHWKSIHFPSAIRTARVLRTQTIRPELAWKLNYEDVNLMSQGDMGGEALKTLGGRLRQASGTFRISDRLDLPNFGRAVGNAKQAGRGRSIFQQIFSRCRLRSDKYYLNLMLGAMYKQAEMHSQAAKAFLNAAQLNALRPIDGWGEHAEAAGCLREAKSAAYLTVQMRYFNRIRTAQDVAPRLLKDCVSFCKAHGALSRAGSYLKKLRQMFPASSERGDAEGIVRKK
ncbi:MAG: tetratricopeptide repeat protein [Phycisphaerae bacterium]|nr:tetratricopeptide repeat protein [Phycisphaerae bacterium]